MIQDNIEVVETTEWLDYPSIQMSPFELDVLLDSSCTESEQAIAREVSGKLPHLLQAFWQVISEKASFEPDLNSLLEPALKAKSLSVELLWVTNTSIQRENKLHRRKDEATDVLSFPMETMTPDGQRMLGSILVSVPWAITQTADSVKSAPQALEWYLLERVTHGLLHLLGIHHNTMEAYNRVVAIQREVFDRFSDFG